MKTKTLRILPLILSLALIVTVLPLSALADDSDATLASSGHTVKGAAVSSVGTPNADYSQIADFGAVTLTSAQASGSGATSFTANDPGSSAAVFLGDNSTAYVDQALSNGDTLYVSVTSVDATALWYGIIVSVRPAAPTGLAVNFTKESLTGYDNVTMEYSSNGGSSYVPANLAADGALTALVPASTGSDLSLRVRVKATSGSPGVPAGEDAVVTAPKRPAAPSVTSSAASPSTTTGNTLLSGLASGVSYGYVANSSPSDTTGTVGSLAPSSDTHDINLGSNNTHLHIWKSSTSTAFKSEIKHISINKYESIRPSISEARVNTADTKKIILAMSEEVTGSPANSDFTVKVGSTTNAVTSISISGSTVTLTISTNVYADAIVKLTYSGTSIKDLSGNALEKITSEMIVKNSVTSSSGDTSGGVDTAPVTIPDTAKSFSATTSLSGSTALATINDNLLKTSVAESNFVTVVVPEVSGASVYKTVFSSSIVNITNKTARITISGPNFSVTFTPEALRSVTKSGADTFAIETKVGGAKAAGLSDAAAAVVGDMPVLSVRMLLNDSAVSWNNPDYTIVASFKCGLPASSQAGSIGVYNVAADGVMTIVPSGRLNPETGFASATLSHFSFYTVKYTSRTFSDLSGHWAKTHIEALASRGVIDSIFTSAYGPDAAITRGEMLDMIVKAFGLYSSSPVPFTDSAASRYADSIAVAHALGIANGYGDGTFAPNSLITRDEAMTLLGRALDYAKSRKMSTANKGYLTPFEDRYSIQTYAIDYIANMIAEGLVGGYTPTVLGPKREITRSQVCKILDMAGRLY